MADASQESARVLSPLVRRIFMGNDHRDLSVACRASGLPYTGTKAVLVDRLFAAGVPAMAVGTRQMAARYISVLDQEREPAE